MQLMRGRSVVRLAVLAGVMLVAAACSENTPTATDDVESPVSLPRTSAAVAAFEFTDDAVELTPSEADPIYLTEAEFADGPDGSVWAPAAPPGSPCPTNINNFFEFKYKGKTLFASRSAFKYYLPPQQASFHLVPPVVRVSNPPPTNYRLSKTQQAQYQLSPPRDASDDYGTWYFPVGTSFTMYCKLTFESGAVGPLGYKLSKVQFQIVGHDIGPYPIGGGGNEGGGDHCGWGYELDPYTQQCVPIGSSPCGNGLYYNPISGACVPGGGGGGDGGGGDGGGGGGGDGGGDGGWDWLCDELDLDPGCYDVYVDDFYEDTVCCSGTNMS